MNTNDRRQFLISSALGSPPLTWSNLYRVKLLSADTTVLGDDLLDPAIPSPNPDLIPDGIRWSSDHGAPFAQLSLKIGKG